ncbi:sigma-70 family RNA polymerase sigma factor [Candidatus Poribacteria bacterium]|nr:sigma-70 family RNA polymerase sigma factor [Candidatus Poribacteria bacterium]
MYNKKITFIQTPVEEEQMPDVDDKLMLRCKNGDKSAFDLVVERHRLSLVNFIARMGIDYETAEDIAQETFIRIYRAAPRYKVGSAKFTTWMYHIASNLCKNELRNRGRHSRYITDLKVNGWDDDGDDTQDVIATAPADVLYQPDHQLEQKELQRIVQQAIEKIPEKYRLPLVLRDIQELDYKEISQIVKIPVGTVKSRINRARLMLKDKLKSYVMYET